MEKRRLGSTDIEITPIGLGCMQFSGPGLVEQFYPALDQVSVTPVVRSALDGGINWFDTAEMYGRGASERALTTALQESGAAPGSVVIATKWKPFPRTADSIGRTIDTRISFLQGYPIDLHQIHMPYGSLSSIPRQVRAMAALRHAGKVSAVGVSNFSARQMRMASELLRAQGLTLASNQVQISLLHRNIERDGVLEAARQLGVTLIAYSPLSSGILSGKFHEDPAMVRSRPRTRRLVGGLSPRALARTAPLVDGLRSIAAAHGATASQVALSWLTTYYGETVVVIPGGSKPHHAQEAAAAMHLRLTEKELTHLDDLSRRGRQDVSSASR